MKINIDSKYKFAVKVALFLLPVMSIATALFSFPLELSVTLAVLMTIISLILNRFVFKYKVVHIMPMPTQDMLKHKLGTSWFAKNTETMEGLGIVVIFKYKRTAKSAYDMFKQWNYGKVIDKSENISFKVVREKNGKYSAFLYPGDRLESIMNSASLVKDMHGEKSEVAMRVVKFFMQFGFDYSNDGLKTKCIESLPYVDELNLNVGYVENNEVKMYSKRGFRLKNFSITDRDDVGQNTIENLNEWVDPAGKLAPINQAVIDSVSRSLEPDT